MRTLALLLVVVTGCLDFGKAESECIQLGKCIDGDGGVPGGGTAGGSSGGTAGGSSGGQAGGTMACAPTFGSSNVQISIDLNLFGGVSGVTVASIPPNVSCDGGSCSGLVPRGAFSLEVVGLDAGMRMGRWIGNCSPSGFGTRCDVCPSSPTQNFRVRIWPDDNLVFSAPTNLPLGEMGGVDGGDAICATRAAEYGLPGTYRAWLGTAREAAARLAGARGWRRVDGLPFADGPDELADGGALWSTMHVSTNVMGHLALADAVVATGALPDGGRADCAGWTVANAASAGAGAATAAGLAWQDGVPDQLTCNGFGSLYCFGVDRSRPVAPSPRPAGSRVAFLSSPFSVAGGITGADSHCAGEALDAGLSGSFWALLTTSTQGFRSRFNLDGGWYRLDGIPFSPGAATDVSDHPVAPLNLTLSQGYAVGAPSSVFTGAPNTNINGVPTAASICGNWQQTTGNTTGGTFSRSSRSWWTGAMPECGVPARLYCLQR